MLNWTASASAPPLLWTLYAAATYRPPLRSAAAYVICICHDVTVDARNVATQRGCKARSGARARCLRAAAPAERADTRARRRSIAKSEISNGSLTFERPSGARVARICAAAGLAAAGARRSSGPARAARAAHAQLAHRFAAR